MLWGSQNTIRDASGLVHARIVDDLQAGLKEMVALQG
jgi:hypothetical protein